jgi:phosphoglycolate phosphatase
MSAVRAVLFDLDGTLSDSAPGILAALHAAFADNGLPRLDAETERSLLGPPFYQSLPALIDASRVPDVIAAYRRHYAAGALYDMRMFPGVDAVVRDLHSAGVRLAVATSKPEVYAEPIVERLGLAGCFATVCGDTLEGDRPTKAAVIEECLRRLGIGSPSEAVMVGDRSYDVLGARAHGIDCIAVTWGYATPGELATAGPAAVVSTPASLAAELRARLPYPGS